MAYLPTVNEFKDANDSKESIASSILEKVKPKNLSSVLSKRSMIINKNIEKTFTIEKENSGESLLTKMYTFIATDYKRKKLMDLEKRNRIVTAQKESDDRITKIASVFLEGKDEKKKDEKDKKTFGLGLGIFVTAGVGMFLYRNMDELENMLDVKSIEASIDKLKDEFDMTSVMNNIKTVINDVVDQIQKLKIPDFNFDLSNIGKTEITAGTGIGPENMGLRKILKKGEAKTYNTLVGGKEVDLTSMSIDEVLEYQKTKMGGLPSTAAGKYQMIRGTLSEAKTSMGLSGSEKFDPSMQDKIYQEYLTGKKRPKLQKYLSGQSEDIESAQLDLAKEFASVGVPYDIKNDKGRLIKKGESYYSGTAGNKASITPEQSRQALIEERGIRTGQIAVDTQIPKQSNSITSTASKSMADGKSGRVKQAMNYFMSQGWTKEQSAGIVGNLYAESGFAEDVISGQRKGDKGTAVGIAQWHPDRQNTFKKVMKKNVEGASFEDQLKFVQYELTQGKEDVQARQAGTQLKQAKSVSESASIVNRLYERSEKGLKGIHDERIMKSQNVLEMYDTIKTDKHVQIPKSVSEPGELDNSSSGKTIPATQQTTINDGSIATDADLIGLTFINNPREQRQILKALAVKVQQLKSAFGVKSFIINSGYRSPAYNEALRKQGRGAAKNSLHTHRMAVDINCNILNTSQRAHLIRLASKIGFGGIGVYSSFIHFDIGKRRTWVGEGYKVPGEIATALNEHRSGKLSQESIGPTPSPQKIEEEKGEKSNTEKGKSITSLEQEQKKPFSFDDFIQEQMAEATEMSNMLNSAMNLMKETDVTKISGLLQQFSQSIPRKEKLNTQTPIINAPTTNMINNVKQENNYNQNDFSDDSPALFVNPFLAQLGKLNG
jgi:uncharacterized protein YcbK (DUF882 family)